VSDSAGVLLIVAGAAGVLVGGFWLRTRLPAPVVFLLVAGFSVALTAGALVVQDRTTTADWIVALTAMGLLGPAHVRVLLGPFGRRANGPQPSPNPREPSANPA
jgi:hypothetical protein